MNPSSDPHPPPEASRDKGTEDDGKGLLRSALRGIFWTSGGTAVQAGLQIVVLMVLARVLRPDDFGLLAAAMVVVGFSDIFAKLGVGPALVQRETLEDRHRESGLIIAVALGFLTGVLLYLCAGPAASFFNVAGLEPVVQVLSALFPVTGIGVVSRSHLSRDLAFRTLARIQVMSYAIGYGGVGITLAFAGAGVWALVAAVLGERVVSTLMALWSRPPRIRLRVDASAVRELLLFGSGHTAMRLSNFFAMRGDYMVAGRILGMTALGFYERAYRLMAVPVTLMGSVVDQVFFPTLSRIQADSERLGRAYLSALSVTALALIPLSALSWVLAPEIIDFFLGGQWDGAVAPFRILVVGLYLRGGYRMGMVVVQARGAVYRGARLQAIYAVLVVAGAWIGTRWGIEGVAFAVLLALGGMFVLTARLVQSITGHPWRKLLRGHVAPVVLAALAGGTGLICGEVSRSAGSPALVTLVVSTGLSLVVLATITRVMPHWVLEPDVREMARSAIERAKNQTGA